MNPLGFTDAWFQLGVVTAEQVQTWEEVFATGDDPNPEHFRWAAFRNYLKANEPDAAQLESLYELGDSDQDKFMGSAIMFAVIERKDCPKPLVLRAAHSDRANVAKLARRLFENAPPGGGVSEVRYERSARGTTR